MSVSSHDVCGGGTAEYKNTECNSRVDYEVHSVLILFRTIAFVLRWQERGSPTAAYSQTERHARLIPNLGLVPSSRLDFSHPAPRTSKHVTQTVISQKWRIAEWRKTNYKKKKNFVQRGGYVSRKRRVVWIRFRRNLILNGIDGYTGTLPWKCSLNKQEIYKCF
jgi:hypothetical protein